MGIFDRFRRNRQQSVLPDEVQQYYQADQGRKRGVAVGLALAAVLVTLAVAAALFFGGRFIYNAITDDEDQKQTESSQNDGDRQNEFGTSENQENNGAANENEEQTPAGEDEDTAEEPAPQPAPQPAPTTPNLGDDDLPHTGDPGM